MQVRQNYGVTIDRGFRPTSNARLAETFTETKRFADALRKFDKYCSVHLKGVKGVPAGVTACALVRIARVLTRSRHLLSLRRRRAGLRLVLPLRLFCWVLFRPGGGWLARRCFASTAHSCRGQMRLARSGPAAPAVQARRSTV